MILESIINFKTGGVVALNDSTYKRKPKKGLLKFGTISEIKPPKIGVRWAQQGRFNYIHYSKLKTIK